jgi:hypothetical protein
MTAPEPVRPQLNDRVHYRSFGTPGGEYHAACRAADVTEVGGWVTVSEVRSFADQTGRRIQEWNVDACSLLVKNPTGWFLQAVPRHDGDPAGDPAFGLPRSFRGGTWHPEGACQPADQP